MRHRTEQELIEYQFKLASDSQMGQIAEHLEKCSQCREHLEQLKQRFASLDLLCDQITVSDDLVARVVEEAGRPVQRKIIPFRKPVWIGAAAAVLMAGLLLLLADNLSQKPVRKSEFTETPKLALPAETIIAEGGVKITAAEKPKGDVGQKFEKPPFAPASAIELVTLPRRENVQLTIYNSADLTLVRERRNLTLKKGWNWLQFMWANTLIDPTSLTLEPLEQKDKVEIKQLVFPARLRELGRWLIHSEVSGRVPFEIIYFTSGLSWRAFYMGTLAQDEKTMRLESYVRVDNDSGEDYENAQTRLIVGTIHILDQIAELARRQYPYGRPVTIGGLDHYMSDSSSEVADKKNAPALEERMRGIVNGEISGLERKEVKKEGLSEYFLYTIEGTENIPDKWGKRLLSFEANDIPVKSLYKYDEERWGTETIRFVAFTNDQKHNLGQTPIPNGDVKIYSQADDLGYLSYVGGTGTKYIPVNEEVELNLGPARLVSVEPKLMDFKTENYVFDTKNNVAGWDEVQTWNIEVTNTRTLPVGIEITRGFETAYWTLQLDEKEISYEKYDVTHARFKMSLEPRSKQTFEWTVRTYHGQREQAMNK